MAGNVSYKMIAVLIFHNVAIKVAGLHEIVVWVRISLSGRLAGYIERRLERISVRCRASCAVGPVIRAGSAVIVNAHRSIPLVAFFRRGFGRVYRYQVIVGTQAMNEKSYQRDYPGLEHLVRRCCDSRHEVAGAKGGLLHLGKVILRIAVQDKPADLDRRKIAVGPDLGDIENIESIV